MKEEEDAIANVCEALLEILTPVATTAKIDGYPSAEWGLDLPPEAHQAQEALRARTPAHRGQPRLMAIAPDLTDGEDLTILRASAPWTMRSRDRGFGPSRPTPST
jgi:hypothetical protein